MTTILAGTKVDAAAVAALAARVPTDLIDGSVIWLTRHGMAMMVLGHVLVERALPPLGPLSYSDRGGLAPMELTAGTRHAGQVDAVAAWALAFDADLVAETPDPQVAVVHLAAVLEIAPDVLLRVWTAVRPPTHDPLVDALLGGVR